MLNIEKYNLKRDDYVLIGVSGGSDSMALLHMLSRVSNNIIVAHVNYHHRSTADRDEEYVKDFCEENNIIFIKKDFIESKGNFQDIARNFRYDFFKEIYDKYNCKALFIAHHLDDAVETYLFKKNRKSIGRSATILEEDFINNMRVIRPLLNLRKSFLEDYCLKYRIIFGIDETNYTLMYERNRIRWDIIFKMSEEEFNSIVEEMNQKQQQ